MLVKGSDILNIAREERFGVGAFNIMNKEDADVMIGASEEMGVPVIVQISNYGDPNAEGPVKMDSRDAGFFFSYLLDRARSASVPVAINLDHCSTFEGCVAAIKKGATNVMIDASMKSFDENVELTKKVVEAAHACNVSVEAEIGHVGANNKDDDNDVYTTVEEAKKFYELTGVDMLAVSIGTAHGVYTAKPVLQFDRISELREAIPIPLVMHGGSGLDPEQYKKCVENGICKINYCTYLQLGAAKAVRKLVNSTDENKLWFMNIIDEGKKEGVKLVKEHINYFGTKPIKL